LTRPRERHLCAEAFEEPYEAKIPGRLLRERLAYAESLIDLHERTIYESDERRIQEVKQSFRDFVALCEEKEKATGVPVTIVASY
jgi:hypothetical protein